VDATIRRGIVTAVVGGSGSGKSTLLRILGLIDRPTAGRLEIAGNDVSALGRVDRRRMRRAEIGYVFQRPSDNLLAHLTAREQIRVAARIRASRMGVAAVARAPSDSVAHELRGANDETADETSELLAAVGMEHRAAHTPSALSGGEQQRVALAAAVVGRPLLVLADEPTAELDRASARVVMELVGRLAARGTSFVVATHDPLVMDVAEHVVHLRHGGVEAETRDGGRTSVIDAFGRIQLPPEALRLFPDRRAQITVDEDGDDGGHVRIAPP
jgi:putative ABC transport system ATP-binding protein